MRKIGVLLSGLMTCLCVMSFLYAQADDSQVLEASQFFNAVVHQTQNPIIAGLAQESLNKLNQEQWDEIQPKPVQPEQVVVKRDANQYFSIPTIVDKEVLSSFVIDTGSTYSLITPGLAQKLGIRLNPNLPTTMIHTGNGLIQAPLVTLHQVTIGGITINNLQCIVQDLGPDIAFGGLLGMNSLKDMRLKIQQDRLVLESTH